MQSLGPYPGGAGLHAGGGAVPNQEGWANARATGTFNIRYVYL